MSAQLVSMGYICLMVVVFAGIVLLLSRRASMVVCTLSYVLFMMLVLKYESPGILLMSLLWLVFAGCLVGVLTPLRRYLLSASLFRIASKSIPAMSCTELEALKAGTVSWEGDLFSGAPDFSALLSAPTVSLTPDEQDFLDGPTHTLCSMVNDWDITHNRTDMPKEVWSYIKDQGFLGMIIPKEYGGLGFSATAQMSVIVKLYSHSVSVATTVSVPNSLGPAELLLHYGTEAQKNYYLPRLAKGLEIPCFALTGPNAGSDAASIPDKGIVCHQTINGKKVLGIRLTWDKRYITLCPVATVIGLAFRLFDPEQLLGQGTDIGISCALIPADTPGVIKGRRHFPLNTAFMNGPTQGTDVFIPMDYLIGGVEMAGHGWSMLMECLSAGRAISLPSSASGGAQAAAMASGAYARVRKQFNQPIAKFEGIEEPLARIAANTYIIDAALTMTAAAIDQGAKPSVAGAILKYHTTERSRQVAMDAMDIHGGKGICLGPNNYLGRFFQGCPISITVEGANILSRCLIIFGQGAIRCHPYVFAEMESVRNRDLKAFDQAVWGHLGFILSNAVNAFGLGLSDGYFSSAPKEPTYRYYQLLKVYSSQLAFLADFCMLILGGELKRKEKLSARLGDILSALYLVSAVLKRFHEDGQPASDLPLVAFSCQQLLHEAELAINGVIRNFPTLWGRGLLKMMLQPLGRRREKPSDKLGQQVASILTVPSDARQRLTRLNFVELSNHCPLGQLEQAFHKICAVDGLEKKVQRAIKEGHIHSLSLLEQIKEAVALGVLDQTEGIALHDAELARQSVIKVDDFSTEELCRT